MELTDEEDDKIEELDTEISDLRSAKKKLFEKARPINDELEKLAKRERECIDEQYRLRLKKHNREREKPSIQHVAKLEFELKQVNCENEKLSDVVKKLEQSLDHATKQVAAKKQKIAELEKLLDGKMANDSAETQSKVQDNVAATKLRRQLNQANELLSKSKAQLDEMRQRLSDVQERLTVAEQVTAATQRRELQESGNSEQLQLELTPQHQPTIPSGTGILTVPIHIWFN